MAAIGWMLLSFACGQDPEEPYEEGDADTDTDSDSDTDTDSDTDSDTDTDTDPTITITAEGVEGHTGQILLAFVRPSGGGSQLGGICEAIESDPATLTGVVRVIESDPCTLGAAVVFDPGDYDITAGVYTGGSKTPDACAYTTATVDKGPVEVTLPKLGFCF